jgi:excisionase family DNA binding protein
MVKPRPKPERIQTPQVAAILGVTTKTVQDMAARGELPTAARIGRRWTFNEDAIRNLVRAKERETQSTAANMRQWLMRRPPPVAVSPPPSTIDEEYERLIGLRPTKRRR